MKHTLCLAFTFLLLIGYLYVADTPIAATLKAQDAAVQAQAEAAAAPAATTEGREPVQPTRVTVIIEGEDVLQQPGIHAWAAKAAELVVEWFPIFDKIFETDGFVPSSEVYIVFRNMQGVAHATGNRIVISSNWIRSPQGINDFGMVAHELIHVIQRYPGGRGQGGIPFWAMEGVTDFARHAYYEPNVLMRPVNLERARHTDSYQITGGFFMWIEHVYDDNFVHRLHTHARHRTWSDEVFERYTGKDVETLWGEYIEFLRTIPDTRILPSRDFGRVGMGNTYRISPQPTITPPSSTSTSVAPPVERPTGGQATGRTGSGRTGGGRPTTN